MNIEEQVKQFLNEMYSKYKDMTEEEIQQQNFHSTCAGYVYNEYINYFNSLSKEGKDILLISDQAINKLEKYASKSSHNFKCNFLGQHFWRSLWPAYEDWADYYVSNG